MTTESTELLRRYVAERSEPAFAELVRRHVDLVYSAALRQVAGEVPTAQDVTQAVFSDLARQAPRLTRHSSLTGWLYTSTRYLAAKARRTEQRRRAREQEAYAMNQLLQSPETDPVWTELGPILDDAMHELGAVDREAVLLRYFESRPLAEIGTRLGLSENAARMRVDRALDKLRAALAKRGVTSTATALAAVLTERAVGAAPAGLAAHVGHAAFAAGAAGGGLVGLLKLAVLTKAQWLVGAGAAVVVAACLLVPLRLGNRSRTSAPAASAAKTDLASASPAEAAAVLPNAASPASAELTATSNKLVLHIVAADSGQPIPMVTLDCWLWENGQAARTLSLLSTRFGVCEVPVPRDTVRVLIIRSRTDGFVDTTLSWSPARGEAIPQEYQLRLACAVPIGGLVVDGDGKPIAGAEVSVQSLNTALAMDSDIPHISTDAGEKTVTDADGRWRIDRFAKDATSTVIGGATHPDYIADLPFNFGSATPDGAKRLVDGTFVFKLDGGLAVRGVIVDPNGQPVPETTVMVRSIRRSRATTNQVDGTFNVAGCEPGPNQLSAEAKGFALATLEVDLTNNSAPIRLTLQPGKLLRLRVLDTNGLPVTNATVSLNPSLAGDDGSRAVPMRSLFNERTDADGRVVWNSAPDRELLFSVHAPGYVWAMNLRVRPDGEEHVVTLAPAAQPLTVLARVRDAATDQPIPRFRVIIGSSQPIEAGVTNFSWNQSLDGKGGKFRHVEDEVGIAGRRWVYKFEADGYAPFVTRAVRADEGEIQFDIAMRAAASTTVSVLLPDGRPGAKVDIGLESPGARLSLIPGGLRTIGFLASDALLSTDDAGRFALPPDEAVTRVLAAHPDGYAEATPAALAAEPIMRLRQWGRLEGTFLSGGKPAADRELTVESTGPGPRTRWFEFRVRTDADGHFTFSKVPPGKLKLVLLIRFRDTPLTDVDAVPGETKTVTVGAYTVTAHLGWPADLKRQADWPVFGYIHTPLPPRSADVMSNPQAFAAWRETPEVKAAYANMQNYQFTETAEGEMTAEDVPAGSYVLSVNVSEAPTDGKAKRLALGEVPFTVPADPPSGTLDLGEIVLKPAQ